MKIAALQSSIVWEDPEANFARLDPWIEQAAGAGARLMVLPEMFACGFTMDTARVAEPIGGPSTRYLVHRAARYDLWLAGSIPELPDDGGRPSNTLLLVSPTGAIHRYRKIHPFTYAGEHEHYDAGSEHVTVDVEGLRISLFVCYDLRFADEFWAVAESTDAYVVVANWPETRRHHWQTLLAARAIENQAYVVGVNRAGDGGGLVYTGDSAILDPMGHMLASASRQESLLFAEIDAAEVARVRRELPFLPDRR